MPVRFKTALFAGALIGQLVGCSAMKPVYHDSSFESPMATDSVFIAKQTVVCRNVEVKLNGIDLRESLTIEKGQRFSAYDFSGQTYMVNGFVGDELPDHVVGLKLFKNGEEGSMWVPGFTLYLAIRPNGQLLSKRSPFLHRQSDAIQALLLAAEGQCTPEDGELFEAVID